MTIAGAISLDIILSGKGNLKTQLKDINSKLRDTEKGMNNVGVKATGLSTKMMRLAKSYGTAAAKASLWAAAGVAIAKVGESGSLLQAQLSALGDTAGSAFKKIEKMAEGAKGLYSVEDLIKVQARSKELGINLALTGEQLVKLDAKFTRLGFSGGDALQMLVESLATGRRGFLKKLGFVHDAHSAHVKYAKFIGVANASELSAGQRILSLQHSVVESLRDISTEGGSTIDQTEQASASFSNLMMEMKLMLAPMSAITAPLGEALHNVAKIVKTMLGPAFSLLARTVGLVLTMFAKTIGLFSKFLDGLVRPMISKVAALAKAAGMDGLAGDLQFLTAEADDSTVALKDMDNAVKDSTVSMLGLTIETKKGVLVLTDMASALLIMESSEERVLKLRIKTNKAHQESNAFNTTMTMGQLKTEELLLKKQQVTMEGKKRAHKIDMETAKSVAALKSKHNKKAANEESGVQVAQMTQLKRTHELMQELNTIRTRALEVAVFAIKATKKKTTARKELNKELEKTLTLAQLLAMVDAKDMTARRKMDRDDADAHHKKTRSTKEEVAAKIRLLTITEPLNKAIRENAMVLADTGTTMSAIDAPMGNMMSAVGGMTDLWGTAAAREEDMNMTLLKTTKMIGPAAMGFIEGKKEQAIFMGSFEAAMAMASAFINPAESYSHAIASAMFFALAGTVKDTGGTGAASSAPRGKKEKRGGDTGGTSRTVVVNFGSGIVLGDKAQIAKAIQGINHSVISTGDKWAT